jgi:hypothetical protein
MQLPQRVIAGGLIGASALALLVLAAGLYVMEQRTSPRSADAEVTAEENGGGSTPLIGGPVPPASQIVTNGDPVGFKVCQQVTNWQRPDPLSPNDVYADHRFGKDGKPTPSSYFLAQGDFFDMPMADSASINKYLYAVTGILDEQPAAAVVEECNPASFYKDFHGMTHSFNLLDHRMVASYRLGDDYVLVVDEAPKSWQAVFLPYPPDMSTYQRNFASVQFLDTDGRLLFRERALALKGSVQMTR